MNSSIRISIGIAATFALTGLGHAQSFNLDIGSAFNGAGVPQATYGGAAGQFGVWNSLSFLDFYTGPINDLNGNPTSITCSGVGIGADVFFDNAASSGGDGELLDDCKGDPTTWTFSGLADGTYDIYTYAWAPDDSTFTTQVTVGTGTPTVVGGNYTGGPLVPGITHAIDTVNVVGGTLVIDIDVISGFASTNGFQFVTAGSTGSGICNGDGGDQMGCTDCPCGNNAAAGTTGGCLNSAGSSTRLLRSGSDSVAAMDLRFEAVGAPPQVSAVLTSGNSLAPANMANPCFGLDSGIQSISLDGLRCAVQGVLRHGVRPSDANGDVGVTTNGWGTPNGFFQFSAFLPGSTKHFQVIHRDDSAQVCGTGQNTSQAISVTFAM